MTDNLNQHQNYSMRGSVAQEFCLLRYINEILISLVIHKHLFSYQIRLMFVSDLNNETLRSQNVCLRIEIKKQIIIIIVRINDCITFFILKL